MECFDNVSLIPFGYCAVCVTFGSNGKISIFATVCMSVAVRFPAIGHCKQCRARSVTMPLTWGLIRVCTVWNSSEDSKLYSLIYLTCSILFRHNLLMSKVILVFTICKAVCLEITQGHSSRIGNCKFIVKNILNLSIDTAGY